MRRAWAIGALILAILLAPSAASATAAPDVVEGERLRLVSVLDERAATDLSPGQRVDWLVEVSAAPGDPGRIDISLAASGEMDVDVTVLRCAVAWTGGSCAAGAERLRTGSAAPRDGSRERLLRIDADETARLLLSIAAPADAQEGERTELRVLAHGLGEEIEAGSAPDDGDGLATTGNGLPWFVVWGGIAIVGVGTTLAVDYRRRRART